ncbi:phytosulfokine receptor 1 [Amborella trichopoda]|uniref:non-specific serine/threonine protein kinase n=1 Tax=Amborella trichopoda TaxID=13333 RepID=W1PP90_AMBTC|nr:phytosulfokine receptor 1 [Amborella trichopoda]ERN09546.1 hypothetical protein AMTR_s00029p00150520 [Amborella trichopoda]|eukprot:XP_006847965.1 phytosulfokine receptor 1 [Amborella trichopoda]
MGFWGFLILVLGFLAQFRDVNSQNQRCSSSDLDALMGFMAGLSQGINGWGNDSYCCSWRGVFCGSSGAASSSGSETMVIRLVLRELGLNGSISRALASLDQLQTLDLSLNMLYGSVPSELFRLQRLEYLDLSYNKLSGNFTDVIGLPSVRVFNISSNFFDGQLPLLSGPVNLTVFNISNNSFTGSIDAGICRNSGKIQAIDLSMNLFSGYFPVGFGNCRSLQILSLSCNSLSGQLPDDLFGLSLLEQLSFSANRLSGNFSNRLGNLSKLVILDLSANGFSGPVPEIFGNLKNLQTLFAYSNRLVGPLPSSLSNCSGLRMLNLKNNSLSGTLSLDFSMFPRLNLLDVGSNHFEGLLPASLSSCQELKTINLGRNGLSGQIPQSFANMQSLSFLSLSNNSFHNISEALGILQQCRSLTSLILTMNFQGEEMPIDINGFGGLKFLAIPNCGLSGFIPPWLQNCENLQVLDLSWNHLSGSIPPWIGDFERLFYLDLSNNSFTGEIPKNLTLLKSLISRSYWPRDSTIEMPVIIKRNHSAAGFQYNQISSFPPTLSLAHNGLGGPIWEEFGNLRLLHVLDLSSNNLSGSIPSNLSNMRSLEILDLSFNNLSGSIPFSLCLLTFLSSISVAYNQLQGPIPTGSQFSTFSARSFYGNPGLCGSPLPPCNRTDTRPYLPSLSQGKLKKNRTTIIVSTTLCLGIWMALFLAVVFIIASRRHRKRKCGDGVCRTAGGIRRSSEFSGSRMVILFQPQDKKELTICDLLKATDNFDQANIIGCGGFGLVYRATLPDGRKVAIKRLSGDCGQMDREFQAEVESLSRAQHKNLVLLQGYCRHGDDRLLIYSFMENGSLDYWLHERLDGGSMLDWASRLRMAQGAAHGLAYLHQTCEPNILHRDIKSSNILLDEEFEAHLADFGLARLILPYDTHVTTDLVGTLGYIPPEYGQASVATFKGDVYSFGVVLLELLTGKRPVDVCKPKGCRDLVSWILQLKSEGREEEVFDPFVYEKEHSKQMLQMLEVACSCVNACPKARPFICQVVSWLDSIGADSQQTK